MNQPLLIRDAGSQVRAQRLSLTARKVVIDSLVVAEVESLPQQLPLEIRRYTSAMNWNPDARAHRRMSSSQYSVVGRFPARAPQVRTKTEFNTNIAMSQRTPSR